MSTATKIAKVALTALALKKLGNLTLHGKHETGSHALEAAIHKAHAAAFGDDEPEDDDDRAARDDDDDDDESASDDAVGPFDKVPNHVNIPPAKALAQANKRIADADAELPDHKRIGGKPSPLSGKSMLKAWAATPGGRNTPRPQRRG